MDDMIKRLKPRGELLSQESSKAMLAAVLSAPSQRRRRRSAWVLTAACVLVVGVASAVWVPRFFNETDRNGAVTGGSCVAQLRLNGVVYDGWDYVERAEGQRVGLAEMASCDDVGRDARGSYFPDEPRTVEVWSLPPVETTKAVGVLQGRGFTVYVAAGLSDEERQRVLEQLGLSVG